MHRQHLMPSNVTAVASIRVTKAFSCCGGVNLSLKRVTLALMPKMPSASEDHGYTCLISRSDRILVSN